MDYFKFKRAKKHAETADKSEEPVLNDEDEAFLYRVISAAEGTPPPLPDRPLPQDLPEAGKTNNAQIALMNGAQDIPLPDIPDTPDEKGTNAEGESSKDKGKGKEKEKDKKSRWSFLRRDSKSHKRNTTATDLQSAADELKSPKGVAAAVPPDEAKKEQDEMSLVLDQLNLAAVNNRVFSISDESKELLKKFTLVLKDLVNGVPTAYGDLESLLTNSEGQLQNTYKSMPGFMQSLIEKLPSKFSEKFTESVGPEVLAAAAAKHGIESTYLSKGVSMAEKSGMKVKVPSLKELVTKQGAIASLLKAIMNFLRQRFPAVLGMNVLWSLALFVLLLMFWYCHKRGREVRLEKERKITEEEMAAIKAQVEAEGPGEYHPDISSMALTTTAPQGASIEQIREGMLEVEAARREGQEGAGYAEGGSLAQAIKDDEGNPATKEGEAKAKKAGENAAQL